jgi:hypothetical protein
MRDVRALVKEHPAAVRTATAAVALAAAMFVQVTNVAAESCGDFCWNLGTEKCAGHGGCSQADFAPGGEPPYTCQCSGWCVDTTYWS